MTPEGTKLLFHASQRCSLLAADHFGSVEHSRKSRDYFDAAMILWRLAEFGPGWRKAS